MVPYLLVIFCAIATVVADWFAKSWALSRVPEYFIVALFLYTSASVGFIFSLTMEKLTVLNAIWVVLVFVITTLVGMLLFHESTTLIQKTALGFGFISIALFAIAEFVGR